MRSAVCIASVLLCAALSAAPAEAAIESDFALDLQLDGADIFSSGVHLAWTVDPDAQGDVITGKLLLTGKASSMDIDDLPPHQDYYIFQSTPSGWQEGGEFLIDIDVRVDFTPGYESITATGGSLRIEGYLGHYAGFDWLTFSPIIDIVGWSGVLLAGEVTEFGFQGSSLAGRGILEFTFAPTGGDLTESQQEFAGQTLFGGAIGVIYNTNLLHDQNGLMSLTLSSFRNDFVNGGGDGDAGTVVVPEPTSWTVLAGLISLGAIFLPRRASRSIAC